MDNREIEERIAHAFELHELNYNCAQCVALSCGDLADIDRVAAFKLLEGFGGGMANGSQTCGALSGAIAVISYASSHGPDDPTTKKSTYAQVAPLVDEFRNLVGSTICKEIKGGNGAPMLRSCNDCIADGIRLAIAALGR